MRAQLLVVGFLLVLIVASFALRGMQASPDLPVLGAAPEFQLVDSNGEAFRSAQLKGKPWIASFFFTSCKATCPTLMGALARFREQNVTSRGQYSIASISVDPSYDTPEVLRSFASKFSAGEADWKLLTGDRAVVENLITDGFKVGTKEEPLLHTNRFLLFDGEGHLRGAYNGMEPEQVRSLQSDLASLLN